MTRAWSACVRLAGVWFTTRCGRLRRTANAHAGAEDREHAGQQREQAERRHVLQAETGAVRAIRFRSN